MVKTSGCSKRANIAIDTVVIIVMLFAFGITGVLMFNLFSDFNADVQADDEFSNVSKAESAQFFTNYPQVMDQAFVFLLALLWIALLVTTYLIDVSPAFFIVILIISLFVFVLAMELANNYIEFTSDSELSTASSQFPLTRWVFDNFLVIIIAVAVSAGVVMYAKQ